MKEMFPERESVRDLQILRGNGYREMIGFNGEAAELVPDVLLVFSGEGADGRTTIALEIEKTRKSDFRLLKNFAS